MIERDKERVSQIFCEYLTNTPGLYADLSETGLFIADRIREAIDETNRLHAGQIGGAALIVSEQEQLQAILAYFAELIEFIEWELIGQHRAERATRYAVEVTGDVVTVRHTPTGWGFRFTKGAPNQQQALTVIAPDGAEPSEGERFNARAAFLDYAAYRWPVEFDAEHAAPSLTNPPKPAKQTKQTKERKKK